MGPPTELRHKEHRDGLRVATVVPVLCTRSVRCPWGTQTDTSTWKWGWNSLRTKLLIDANHSSMSILPLKTIPIITLQGR